MELLSMVLVVLCMMEGLWASSIMDSNGGQCEIKEKNENTLVIFDLSNIDRTLLKISTEKDEVITTDMCYAQCCELMSKGCNVANFAEHNGSRVCLSLHCEENTCETETHKDAYMAILSPSTSINSPQATSVLTGKEIIDHGGLTGPVETDQQPLSDLVPETQGTETEHTAEVPTQAEKVSESLSQGNNQSFTSNQQDVIDSILDGSPLPSDSIDFKDLKPEGVPPETQASPDIQVPFSDTVLGSIQQSDDNQETSGSVTTQGGQTEIETTPEAEEEVTHVPVLQEQELESAPDLSQPDESLVDAVTEPDQITQAEHDVQSFSTGMSSPQEIIPEEASETAVNNPLYTNYLSDDNVNIYDNNMQTTNLFETTEAPVQGDEKSDMLEPSTVTQNIDDNIEGSIGNIETGQIEMPGDDPSSWQGEENEWSQTLAEDDWLTNENSDLENTENNNEWNNEWGNKSFNETHISNSDNSEGQDNNGDEEIINTLWPSINEGDDFETGNGYTDEDQEFQWSEETEETDMDNDERLTSTQVLVGGLLGATVVFLVLMGIIGHKCRAKERAKYKPLREDFIPNYGDDMQYYDEEP